MRTVLPELGCRGSGLLGAGDGRLFGDEHF